MHLVQVRKEVTQVTEGHVAHDQPRIIRNRYAGHLVVQQLPREIKDGERAWMKKTVTYKFDGVKDRGGVSHLDDALRVDAHLHQRAVEYVRRDVAQVATDDPNHLQGEISRKQRRDEGKSTS